MATASKELEAHTHKHGAAEYADNTNHDTMRWGWRSVSGSRYRWEHAAMATAKLLRPNSNNNNNNQLLLLTRPEGVAQPVISAVD